MKYLLLIFAFVLNTAFASQWYCPNQAPIYFEQNPGGECYTSDNHDALAYPKLVDVQVDDLSKPITSKQNITNVADENAALALNSASGTPFCTQGVFTYGENGGPWMAWCAVVTGYEQKTVKQLQVDTVAKAAADAQLAQDAALASSERAVKWGQHVVAFIRAHNMANPNHLTVAQIVSMNSQLAPIVQLLFTGSFDSASSLINAMTPDGVIFTSDFKTAVLAEIAKFTP